MHTSHHAHSWGVHCVLQFITVFLGSFIAGSVLNQARALISNPTSILSTLGTAAPLTSIFFLTFIELNVRPTAYISWPMCFSCFDLHRSVVEEQSSVHIRHF